MVNWNRLEIVLDTWNKEHVLKQGVKKNEIENALRGEIYVKRMGEVYGVIGNSFGRILFIVLAERGGNRVYPITARDADESMKKLYKKKVRI
jgi:uncharacterized DUF497 family protein